VNPFYKDFFAVTYAKIGVSSAKAAEDLRPKKYYTTVPGLEKGNDENWN
jgi:hypothetical protein